MDTADEAKQIQKYIPWCMVGKQISFKLITFTYHGHVKSKAFFQIGLQNHSLFSYYLHLLATVLNTNMSQSDCLKDYIKDMKQH